MGSKIEKQFELAIKAFERYEKEWWKNTDLIRAGFDPNFTNQDKFNEIAVKRFNKLALPECAIKDAEEGLTTVSKWKDSPAPIAPTMKEKVKHAIR